MEYAIKEIARVIGAKTNQLLDDTVSLLLTDSRRLSFPEKSLFFALKTKTNDGHRYIQELYKLRVRNFVVSDMLPEFESMKDANFLIVKDTLRALQKLATHHRKQFNIPVIGITGSNGKTIVKEFLYQLLHNEFNIVRSPRSYNSQLGVPLSVWQMSEKNTLGIFEAGISQPDEMERLQPIIAPTIGIITNIGEAHQENFLSSNQKCMEKLTLFKNCDVVIYNGDDEFVSNCVAKPLFMMGMIYLSPIVSNRLAFLIKRSHGAVRTPRLLCLSSLSIRKSLRRSFTVLYWASTGSLPFRSRTTLLSRT